MLHSDSMGLSGPGEELQGWLDTNQRPLIWLVDEMNRRRREAGVASAVGRSNLWRWMTGKLRINVDDATLIEQITEGAILATRWSIYSRARDKEERGGASLRRHSGRKRRAAA